MFQFQAKAVPGIESVGRLDQAEGEVLLNAPVAGLVGVGKGTACDTATNPQMIELGRLRMQAGFDIAQTFSTGQLREGHAQELIEIRKGEGRRKFPLH